MIPFSELLHGVISVSVVTYNGRRAMKSNLCHCLLSCSFSNEFHFCHLTGVVAEADRIRMGFSLHFSKVSKDN